MINRKIFKIIYITSISLVILTGCSKNKTTTPVENTEQKSETQIIETNKPTETPTEMPKDEIKEKKEITDTDIREAAEIIKENSIIEQIDWYKKTCSDPYPEYYNYNEGVAEIKKDIENTFNFDTNTRNSKAMYKIIKLILEADLDVNELAFIQHEEWDDNSSYFLFERSNDSAQVHFVLDFKTEEVEIQQYDYNKKDWVEYSNVQEALDNYQP